MPATFTDIAKSRYVLLTTFTKDGLPKPTPIWVAPNDDRLLAITGATIGRQSAVQVGIDAHDAGQRHRVSMIGLRPCHRVAFPIPGHRQWVNRIHRPPCERA